MKNSRYPSGVPISIKYPDIPLYAFLENTSRKYPERDAVIFYGRKIKYKKLWDEALKLANALKDLGVEKGDRVALLLPNVPQFIISFNGILAAGGIVVPLNPLNSLEEIKRELHETNAKILIALDKLSKKIPQDVSIKQIIARANAYVPWHIKMLSNLRNGGTPSLSKRTIKFEELLSIHPMPEPVGIDPSKDVAVILYTSGTTGSPKGVMLTHRNLVVNALQSYHWLRGWGYSPKPQPAGWPVVACAVPFFHSYGLTVSLNESMQYGCTLVLIPEPTAENIMDAVKKYKVTHLPAIPRFIREILDHPNIDQYDLTSLTSAVTGGATIETELVERFEKVTDAKLYQGYGLTEAGPCTHCTPIEGSPNRRTIGLPFPDTDTRIVDLQLGKIELNSGEKGELIVKGPQIMKGYWNDREGTAQVLKNGWLFTGDIVERDEEGFFYIIGRKLDRLVVSGHTIWPTEVEDCLKAHHAVETAVAVAVPDPLQCANDIEALVTISKNAAQKEIEVILLDYCRKNLKHHQVPAKITVVESLPLNSFGEINRLAVKPLLKEIVEKRWARDA